MGRIRTIKPEFHAHEELSSLPAETHLFAGALVNYADDYGYFNANPVLVKAGTNPLRADGTKVEDQLAQLEAIGYIEVRRSGAKHYGLILKFEEHQRVSHPAPSKIKSKFEELARTSGVPPEVLPNSSGGTPEPLRPEGKGKEQGTGNGKEVAPLPITPSRVAQAVITELGISGRELIVVLEHVSKAASKLPGYTPGDTRDAMVAAWREFDAARPKLEFAPGAVKFFGEGYWRDKSKWQWKAGSAPSAIKPLTLLEKVRLQQEAS